MKFGQLIEHNMINIFFEKLSTKCTGDAIPRPLCKKSKLNISLDQQSKIFIAYKVKDYQNILKLICRALAFTTYKAFLKNKKRPGTSFPPTSSA